MKHIIRTTLVATAALLVGTACTDPTVAPKSTINSETVFTEASAYKSLLAKVYGGLALTGQQGCCGDPDVQGLDEGFGQYWRLYWQMQTLPTDDAIIAWNDQALNELNTQMWSSSNGFLNTMYYRIYFQVAMANVLLRETTTAKLDQRGVGSALRTEIQQYRAEARFLRALSMYHGMDLFGGIPIVTENTSVSEPPAQATRAQVYQFIVDELTAIRSELPAMGAAEYGRVDQGGVAMLLAKVYLNANVYTGTPRYTEAMAEVQAIIGSGAYSLDPNYRRLFTPDNHNSPELIFAIPQDGQRMRNYGGTTFLTHANVGGPLNNANYGINGGWWGLRMRRETRTKFPAIGAGAADGRAAFWADMDTTYITDMFNFTQGTAAPKYTNRTVGGSNGSDQEFVDTDVPMWRLADVYLMYNELQLRGGGGSAATALGYVNALRQRAYGNTSGDIVEGSRTLAFILDERARELYMEGHRRQDLVRYGLFTGNTYLWTWKGNTSAGTGTQSFRDLYPLPASELIANRKLTQNTGY
ncbi:MAG: RagB/SusD family nutrient uptake outer membrane protein [Gemmatimonadaceae bacterium]|nr:RagB/SusD family nutrient uptake outer membrane protein [Gemmatimonadaceae bacterium]